MSTDPSAALSVFTPGTAIPSVTMVVPSPRVAMTVRAATPADVPFIDGLQKMHTHMVGWFPTKQIEGKIAAGQVLIAEERQEAGGKRQEGAGVETAPAARLSSPSCLPPPASCLPLGYVIAQDRYMGRDDVGIIYQLNVVPIRQRGLIGASLIKEVFARAAYGCRLFCCWCAQDIQANYFWESIGFVPLAFRTGSRSKQRIHIFWQRRVREDDKGPGATPYWFPSQTRAGAISEDRLVLPIPPGTHWRDAKPLVLPGVPEGQAVPAEVENTSPAVPGKPLLPAQTPNRPPAASVARKMAIVRSQSRHLKGLPPGKAAILTAGGIRYVERGDYVPEAEPAAPSPEVEETAAKKPKRTAKPRVKNDPKYVAAARELRDRYLEQVNGPDGERLLLTQTTATPKYDVSRLLGGGAGATVEVTEVKPPPQLPAA